VRYPLISRIFLFLAAVLFVVGFFVRMIFASWDVSSLFYVSSGGVCLFLAIILDLQGFYRMLQPRSIRRGLQAFGFFIFMVVTVIAANYVISDYPAKLDMSPQKSHTLSAFSKKIAKSFNDPVEMLYLQIPGPDSKYADDKVMASAKKYQDENPKIRFSKINIAEHPELVEKYRLSDKEQAMIFVYKDRWERFYKTDEDSMTKALLRLLKGRKTIYFSVGHGESKTDDSKSRGLASLKAEIERLFYDVAEINLENEILPKDAAGLAIIGPDHDLSERAGQKVLDYLNGGGRVYLAYDPVQNPDNAGFLHHFGLRLAIGVVHQENSLANVPSFVVSGFPAKDVHHPVLENLTPTDDSPPSPVMFYVTSAIVPFDGPPTDYKSTELIKSIPTSILRAGYLKQDKELAKGAFTLFAVAKNSKGGEIFISGDSDIFANQYLYQQANSVFMFNIFSYLSTDEEMIKTPPPLASSHDFLVTDTIFKIYLGFFILGLPIALFSTGGFMWVRRRWM